MSEQHGLSGRKYEFLEHLSTESLEHFLRLSSDSVDTEAFLDAVTEVIVEREKNNPTGRIPDVDTAWHEFQTQYNTPERLAQLAIGESPFVAETKRPLRRVWRPAAVVAATLIISMLCMIGVQAAGVDVFGALARWTEETFHYVAPTADDPIRTALREQGLPEELMPSYLPEGYTLESLEILESDINKSINAHYTDGEKILSIEFRKYFDSSIVAGWNYQKDTAVVHSFISHGREFYLLSNLESTTATWSDGQSLLINIWGNISETEISDIISSIGG